MIARSLGRNLAAGARLALFMPLRPFDFRVSPADYAALVAFNCLLWLVAAGVRVGFQGEIDAAAVLLYLASVPLVLTAALLVALAYGMSERLLVVATALIASDAVFELAGLALPFLAAWSGLGALVFYPFFAWIWAVAIRAVAVSAGTRRPQFYQGAAIVSAMIAIALFAFPKVDAWKAPDEGGESVPLADERLFHLQGELIEKALAAIQLGRPGVREHYFVGFAPDASEDVFLREMRFVRDLFDERFGSAGRSIVLANTYDALDQLPIASVTNLSRALQRVAKVMNADEDVLVLFVSAHGDADHRLSVSQPPLELAPLTPTGLARLLHEAGIRWRVVVVSACYSGGFVEPLRDENSIIITASAADRTSFGCEPGRDFTYFGQALFRDALARTRSFTEAFELARKLVADQEAAERLPPSLPQIAAGSAIRHMLEAR